MAKVELKQPIVDEIANSIKDAQSVVLVNYSGLTVEQDTALRKELREAGVVYKVYKNTMMHRAFEGTQCEELIQHLHGTNAIAISATDATAPARILAKFAKQYPALELVAGIVEGNYNDQAGIQALSQIPSREELLGKLLGSMQSPITNFARVLKQIAEAGGKIEKFYYCPHLPGGDVAEFAVECDCRKPKPGLILRAFEEYDIDKDTAFLIGDKPRDVESAEAAGIKGYLFEGGSLLDFVKEIA